MRREFEAASEGDSSICLRVPATSEFAATEGKWLGTFGIGVAGRVVSEASDASGNNVAAVRSRDGRTTMAVRVMRVGFAFTSTV